MTDNSALSDRHGDAVSCEVRGNVHHRRTQTAAPSDTTWPPVELDDQEINYVPHFKNLGRMVTTNDSDMPALRYSIQQATVRWHQLAQNFVIVWIQTRHSNCTFCVESFQPSINKEDEEDMAHTK